MVNMLKQYQIDLKQTLDDEIAATSKLPNDIRKQVQHKTKFDVSKIRFKYSTIPEQFDCNALSIGATILQRKPSPMDTYHEIQHIIQNAEGRVYPNIYHNRIEICQNPVLETEAEAFAHNLLHEDTQQTTSATEENLCDLHINNEIIQFRLLLKRVEGAIDVEKIVEDSEIKPTEPKKSVPWNSEAYFEVKEADLLSDAYMKLNPDAKMTDVREILEKLINKTVKKKMNVETMQMKSNFTTTQEVAEPILEIADEESPRYDCLYVFTSMKNLMEYVTYSLEKKCEKLSNTFKVNVINVGQGDAILCTFPDKYLVIDLSSNIKNVIEFLDFKKGGKGISLFDKNKLRIIITHGDADHVGYSSKKGQGIAELEKKLNYKIIIGQSTFNAFETIDKQTKDELITFLGDNFTILEGKTVSDVEHALDYKRVVNSKDANGNSLVMVYQSPTEVVIFTGDLQADDYTKVERTKKGGKKSDETIKKSGHGIVTKLASKLKEIREKAKQENKPLPKVILKVAHHGSKENTNSKLLKFLQESVTNDAVFLVSSGDHKTYNHPSHPLYIQENSDVLYPQGQKLMYQDLNIEIQYTKNIDKRVGSLVHKSSGTGHSTEYTKMFEKVRIVESKKIEEIEAFTNLNEPKEGTLQHYIEESFKQQQFVPMASMNITALSESDFVKEIQQKDMHTYVSLFKELEKEEDESSLLKLCYVFNYLPDKYLERVVTKFKKFNQPCCLDGIQRLSTSKKVVLLYNKDFSDFMVEWEFQHVSHSPDVWLPYLPEDTLLQIIIANPFITSYITTSKLEGLFVYSMTASMKFSFFQTLLQYMWEYGAEGFVSKLCFLLNVAVTPDNAAYILYQSFEGNDDLLIELTYPSLLYFLKPEIKKILFKNSDFANKTVIWDMNQKLCYCNFYLNNFPKWYITELPLEYVNMLDANNAANFFFMFNEEQHKKVIHKCREETKFLIDFLKCSNHSIVYYFKTVHSDMIEKLSNLDEDEVEKEIIDELLFNMELIYKMRLQLCENSNMLLFNFNYKTFGLTEILCESYIPNENAANGDVIIDADFCDEMLSSSTELDLQNKGFDYQNSLRLLLDFSRQTEPIQAIYIVPVFPCDAKRENNILYLNPACEETDCLCAICSNCSYDTIVAFVLNYKSHFKVFVFTLAKELLTRYYPERIAGKYIWNLQSLATALTERPSNKKDAASVDEYHEIIPIETMENLFLEVKVPDEFIPKPRDLSLNGKTLT